MTAGRSVTLEATRDRIVDAAARLLTEGGREAVSTRAVSTAASVQSPTIYRLFGDKQGLLDAVATRGFMAYVNEKTKREHSADPVDDLRIGWELHVGFGLANPALYSVIYGEPRPGHSTPAALVSTELLAGQVRRIAEGGRLRIEERHAVQLVHAAGCGTTLALISMPEDHRDPALSDLAREAVIAAITTDAPETSAPGPASAAVTLRAVLPQTSALTSSEQALMRDWLDRITRN